MNVYPTEQIRNVALVGHSGSGKTLLAEAMAFCAGLTTRMGAIEEGNTISDYHPSELERQMSVFASLLAIPWNDHKINVLDTPGYPDFVGEVIAGLKAADTAVFVMNSVEGVQVGTELAWNYAEQTETPAMFVVNHLDKSDADFNALIAQMQARFGRGATIVQLPAGPGSRAIIDVLVMKQLSFPEGSKKAVVSDIPEAFQARAEELHNELIENIAENDESLMELYFEQGTLSEEEMREGLRTAMINRQLFPIFLTSAKENIGVGRLMDFINNVVPAANQMPPMSVSEGEPVDAEADGSPVAFVFRTMAEQHVGEYSFFKVLRGHVEPGQDLENASTGMERLGQIFAITGKKRDSVNRMNAGDVGAVVKLKNTHTNNTLRTKGSSPVITPIAFPEPRYRTAVIAGKSGDEEKMGQGLNQLHEEDPSLHILHDPDLNQLVLGGQGEMHLEIVRYRLKHRFNVEVEFIKPKISYRETVTKTARSSYRHKKQTGGAGQFADISMLVEPLNGEFNAPPDINVRNVAEVKTNWGATIEYIDAIVGGVIDMRRFFGAIQKGIADALQEGPLAKYPVGDVRIVIFDGGMHSVDSNENAFKTAAKMCFRNAFREAAPVLLEPIHNVEVTVPESYMGEVLGDLNTRRARVQGMEAEGIFQVIQAHVPEVELYRYSTSLRSLTQGRGLHRDWFMSYEAMPRNVQQKVIANVTADEED